MGVSGVERSFLESACPLGNLLLEFVFIGSRSEPSG